MTTKPPPKPPPRASSAARIGILGGSFDPPHRGHLILATAAREQLNLTRTFFLPAADPPHKRGRVRASIEHRLAMLELALLHEPHFEISLVDVTRPGPHYSVDTVKIVNKQFPEAQLYFIMGADSLADLPNWRHPDELLRRCRLAVMSRPGYTPIPSLKSNSHSKEEHRIQRLSGPYLDISSSNILHRLQLGLDIANFLPKAVLAYIREQCLYNHNNPA